MLPLLESRGMGSGKSYGQASSSSLMARTGRQSAGFVEKYKSDGMLKGLDDLSWGELGHAKKDGFMSLSTKMASPSK